MKIEINPLKFQSTRFKELVYANMDRGLWRLFNVDYDGEKHAVGPYYSTKAELLADLTRYATNFGCE